MAFSPSSLSSLVPGTLVYKKGAHDKPTEPSGVFEVRMLTTIVGS